MLFLGDKDYEPMLVDYEKQRRRVTVRFYQPVGGMNKMTGSHHSCALSSLPDIV